MCNKYIYVSILNCFCAHARLYVWTGLGLIKNTMSILLPFLFLVKIKKVTLVLPDLLLSLWPPSLPSSPLHAPVLGYMDCSCCVCLSVCLFQLDAFTQCLFAEPVSIRNHLLKWIYGCRWVDTTIYWGSWAHFLNEHIFTFFPFLSLLVV